eukprot:gb/GECH01001220.1/.p1 GENE.gb/GECH01001220.1/~~gb/GECH01001220.1/.p1  ORF type:complete len:281 (+),score=50.33 gb/GECH01001220.1/:1-843(+)
MIQIPEKYLWKSPYDSIWDIPDCTDHPHFENFPLVFVAFLSGFVFYYLSGYISPFIFKNSYNKLTDSDKHKWNVKLVSTIHGIIAFQGAARLYLLNDDLHVDKNCGWTDTAEFYISLTCGYMLYDFVLSWKAYGLFGFPSILIHHINIVTVFALGLIYKQGFFFMIAFMTNELSQPLLQVSWLLLKMGYQKTSPIFILNTFVLASTFLGSRLFFNSYILWILLSGIGLVPHRFMVLLSWLALLHCIVNYYWCAKVIRMVAVQIYKSLFGSSKSEKEKKKE